VAFRTFSDSEGREWQAFDVIPRASERRMADRRSVDAQAETQAETQVDPQGGTEEERREAERRLTVGSAAMYSPTLRSGWLVFERGADQRRLSPIPENWLHLSDAELEAFLETARPVERKKERRG
jgi:hypothetical protein